MERRAGETEEILNRILEISAIQARFLEENMLAELLESQAERERLLSRLSLHSSPELRRLAQKIVGNDRLLASRIEAMRGEIGSKLSRIRDGGGLIKAYKGL